MCYFAYLQLAMYTEKYDDFQSTLNKSNEVLGKFKTEMDKVTPMFLVISRGMREHAIEHITLNVLDLY